MFGFCLVYPVAPQYESLILVLTFSLENGIEPETAEIRR